MTPKEMRDALARHPRWNALEALTGCFGIPPLRRHVIQAEGGGMLDSQTIRSIPDQVSAIRNTFAKRFPGLVLSNAQVHASVLLVAFNRRRMIERSVTSVVNAQHLSRPMRNWLDAVEYVEPHPVVGMYRDVLGREPDAEGAAFWMREVEAGMPVPQVRSAIKSSFESRRRLS